MKIIKMAGALVVLLVIINGCSEYQLAGRKKTVIVDKISANTFTVNFCGNAYMSQKEV